MSHDHFFELFKNRAMSTGSLLLALALLALLVALVACCCRRRKVQGHVLTLPPAPPGPLAAVQAPYPQQQYAPAPYPVVTSYPTTSPAPYPVAAPCPAAAGGMPLPAGYPHPAPYPGAAPYPAAPYPQPYPEQHYPSAPSAPEVHAFFGVPPPGWSAPDAFESELPPKYSALAAPAPAPAPARPPRRVRRTSPPARAAPLIPPAPALPSDGADRGESAMPPSYEQATGAKNPPYPL